MRLVLAISLAMAVIPLPWPDGRSAPPATGPVFNGAALVRPEGYHTWPLVGASLGLSYAETPQGSGPGAFHRVYVNPSSYEAYERTGTFPDGTMFVLELYAAHEKTAPAKAGYFEGPARRTRGVGEGHAADFRPGGRTSGSRTARVRPRPPSPRGGATPATSTHAARDSVFVQFYPTLRDR